MTIACVLALPNGALQARWLSLRVPITQDPALQRGCAVFIQCMDARAMRVTVHQHLCVRMAEPFTGQRSIDIGVGDLAVLARFALRTQRLGDGAAFGEGAGQKSLLP